MHEAAWAALSAAGQEKGLLPLLSSAPIRMLQGHKVIMYGVPIVSSEMDRGRPC